MIKNARQVAYESIYKVNYEKAYSNIILNQLFRRYEMSYRDRGFVTELVYGTLTRLIYLNRVIAQYSDLRMNRLSPKVLTVLQMGVFQLMFMDSVTDFAAVDETVKLIKQLDFRSTAFVNAVMRKIAREKEQSKDIANLAELSNKIQHFSVKYSVSEYLAGRFLKMYGEEFTEKLLSAFYDSPKLFIRVNSLKTTEKELLDRLSKDGIEAKETSVKGVFSLKGLRGVGSNPSFREGLFSVQDLSSVRAVVALDPRPGEDILDLCSAPGGKTFAIAEYMNNQGRIDALDISEHKLLLLSERAKELGIEIIRTKVSDARVFQKELSECYDKVLVDAPCSGFGIIRRKPELRYKTYEDVKDLPQIQKEILKQAASYLKKSGILVYSTCTLEKKENIEVIQNFLQEHPNFSLVKEPRSFYPHMDQGDGFFVAKMKKN